MVKKKKKRGLIFTPEEKATLSRIMKAAHARMGHGK